MTNAFKLCILALVFLKPSSGLETFATTKLLRFWDFPILQAMASFLFDCDESDASPACLVGGTMTDEEATSACAGKNCCQGERACEWSGKIEVCFAEGSCNGKEACLLSDTIFNGASFIVGANSCSGDGACYNLNMPSSIGDGSCLGTQVCGCHDACYAYYNIGDASCIGYATCYDMKTGSVGDNSCLYGRACNYYGGDVGDNQFQNGEDLPEN